jgi:hypothetical protein
MKTRRCAVCGYVKGVDKFGKGIRLPKTTCLACKQRMLGFVEVKTIMLVKRTTRGYK